MVFLSIIGTLALISILTMLGVLLGVFTGLVPGIHVNLVSFLIVSSSASIFAAVSVFTGDTATAALLAASLITGMMISHSFLDIIPSVFLGAPDPAASLSVLPGHRLVMGGRGYRAVLFSAYGSLGALFVGLALLFPVRFIMGEPGLLYERLVPYMAAILTVLVVFLIVQEGKKAGGKERYRRMGFALLSFFLAGFMGFLLLDSPNIAVLFVAPVGTDTTTRVFFPLFTGLFGLSTLIISLRDNATIPEQGTDEKWEGYGKSGYASTLTGTVAGLIVGWFPGITSASATTAIKSVSSEDSAEDFIMSVSGVNTAGVLFSLVALFTIMKARSGAVHAVENILLAGGGGISEWSGFLPPLTFAALLFSATLASVLAFFLTLKIGRYAAGKMAGINYPFLVKGVGLFLVAMTLVLAGPFGLFILMLATVIGMIPALAGISRVHLMGVLLLPIILYFSGLDLWFLRLLGVV